jgi:uncharacterized protein (DUF488 family)
MAELIKCLTHADVRLLLDIRHSPCASQIDPRSNYGPRDWHLQAGETGLASLLKNEGIDYRWLVELGNPQKNDREMKILKEQLASNDDRWPANRGMEWLLMALSRMPSPIALLCACADYRRCHRTLIAETLQRRASQLPLEIVHLPKGFGD